MGRLIVAQFITLDGVVEDPDGSDGTACGGWAMRYGPQGVAGDKFRLGPILNQGLLLFGRRTWEHFSALWPTRDDPFSQAMNAAAKVVVTHHEVDPAGWANSSRIPEPLATWVAGTVQTRDIVVIGSGSIVAQLAAADLVDEYRLLTFPVAVGAGRRLYPNGVQLCLTAAERVGPATLAIYTAEDEAVL
ncbi:dihydrofolate reductase family protein [Arthrobacter sp. A5]|uniref:dihydrofolate reductase family protein n=1 Tax=Arthrobacter sp. A5 TaxID=576926 RepID=UPI003DA86665